MFVIVQNGVYRHKIICVCSSLKKAKECAERAIVLEPDDYCNYQVVQAVIDDIIPGNQGACDGGVVAELFRKNIKDDTGKAIPILKWNNFYIPTITYENVATEFALALLQGDPVATDAFNDMVTR